MLPVQVFFPDVDVSKWRDNISWGSIWILSQTLEQDLLLMEEVKVAYINLEYSLL